MTTPDDLPDADGVAIRVNDRVMIRNRAGGHMTDDRGNETTHVVKALDSVLGVQVRHAGQLAWFQSPGLTRVESIWSTNDCYWSGEHAPDCRHQLELSLRGVTP